MSELKINDKIRLAKQQHERHLEAAKGELKNENLTQGETRALHVEIIKLEFCLKTLNFISND